ncbi:hypothetical protein ONZ43_g4903 [Nemania bipapillata]|uniref:Uncharacterized protein n=1 Tax=Nemania bipapillata TaxID=110536 RepID=A0ACC2IGU9_9PEZI|nr:hypothetical protein ONZ43_g4903 [Nemania bipapillata]
MEHLALLCNNITLLDLRVPFVAEDYDGNGQFQQLGPDAFNRLVQTWLFFGLLRELFGTQLDPVSFVHEDESGLRINTERLLEHCDTWLRAVPRPDERQLANAIATDHEEPYHLPDILDDETQCTAFIYRCYLKDLASSLDFCAKLCDKLDESIQCNWDADSRKILFSVKLLAEALKTCSDHAIDLFQPLWSACCLMGHYIPEVLVPRPMTPRPGVFLETFLLVEKGWCPSRLSAISSATPAQSLYLFTGYETQDLIGTGHTGCTRDKCEVDAIADDGVEHAAGCPGHDSCRLISVPVQELIDIYKQGHIPLLSSAIDTSGHLDVRVVSSQERPSYATISHVWSDGLKNDHGNALYECQLLGVHRALGRLSRYADARPDVPTVPMKSLGLPALESVGLLVADDSPEGQTHEVFWLDVLCIPRGRTPDEYLEERRQAIGKIDWTFANAEKVLVRDRGLKDLITAGMSGLQLAAHICSSKWLSRCWTLAEGALAWDWTIQFADRTMTFCEILEMTESPLRRELIMGGHFRAASVASYNVLLQRRVQTGLLATVRLIPYERTYKSPANRQFAANWNSLLARATSWKQDRLLILGLVVKVSILDLVTLDPSLRMKAILNTLSDIPAALLFNTSPKVQGEPRNRWVPIEVGPGDWLRASLTIKTYNEGRMVGPLDGQKHVLYRLRAVDSHTFVIPSNDLSDNETEPATFHVALRDRPPTLVTGQDIVLILPYAYGNKKLLDTSCVAFVATVQLENGHACLVRWQCLADVRCVQGSELPDAIEPVQHSLFSDSARVYVECDMTDWPLTTPLSKYLSPDQNQFWIVQLFELPDHPKQLFWTIVVILVLHAGILAESVSDSSTSHMIGGYLLGFSAVGLFFLSLGIHNLSGASIPVRSWRGRSEYGGRAAFGEYKGMAQEEWAELFRSEPDRTDSSLRYNFLKQARRLPSTRRYVPKSIGSVLSARAAEWLAMTNDLLRALQFVAALIITGLGGYMFHKKPEGALSFYIVIVAPITAAWVPLAWASSQMALMGPVEPSIDKYEYT